MQEEKEAAYLFLYIYTEMTAWYLYVYEGFEQVEVNWGFFAKRERKFAPDDYNLIFRLIMHSHFSNVEVESC